MDSETGRVDVMSCQTVRKSLAAFVDLGLTEHERQSVSQHLAYCRECAMQSEELLSLRNELRDLPVLAPPPALTIKLQVLSSHEQLRRRSRATLSAAVGYWTDKVRLLVDNLMRPLALPFAGGLVSAVVLFSMLVPSLQFPHDIRNDVPTLLYTEATPASEWRWRSLQMSASEAMAPFELKDDEIVIELQIDERGRIVHYSVPDGKVSRALLSNVGNLILFSSFYPATSFGQPTPGRVFVSFRRSRIVVKG